MQQWSGLIMLACSVVGAFVAITWHEYVKAWVSHKLGDPLPKARGRLTLNPLNHFEPIGFILMIVTGYGWGKPVPTAAIYYKDSKKGTMLTYTTPSVANLMLGVIFSSLSNLVLAYGLSQNLDSAAGLERITPGVLSMMLTPGWFVIYALLLSIARSNVALAFFNIIPVYPLDGAKILALRLSPETQVRYAAYEKVFQIILIIAMVVGWVGYPLGMLQRVFVN